MPNRLFISAAHKSSGKTTISLGLGAALSQQGTRVQTFKKGPDYIDPMWLAHATGQPCYNLDFYTMRKDEILSCVAEHEQTAEFSLIEGNKGLYDGLDLDGSNSNAALAKLLQSPVVLVIDARGMTRGIAPLILGYQSFDTELRIGGVILNQLGGSRHEQKLRAVIEHYTDIPVIGAVHRDRQVEILERHLGLIPSNEAAEAHSKIDTIGHLIAKQVDLQKLREIAAGAPPLEHSLEQKSTGSALPPQSDIRIGIARDAAFGFYYADDIAAFARAGAELVSIDTLNDPDLPEIDGLFIGGGFPESHLAALEANQGMRQAIHNAIENGLPVYAECGGLMYLSQSISWQGQRHSMVGCIPADVSMHHKPQGRGYVRFEETEQHLWPPIATQASQIQAHEFHYSGLDNMQQVSGFAYRILRGTGIDGKNDGIVYKNMLACYAHLRDTGQYHWVERFVNFVRQSKNNHEDIP